MDKMTEHLIKMSDSLDKAGNTQCANAVDGLLQSGSMSKLAQYVGVIGYVLKQNRAMGNCIRKKRASSDTSMQEVILSCLKEYQDGQQYDNTEWVSKYAQVIKDSPEHFPWAHVELLQVLAEANDIQEHMDKIKDATKVLAASKIEDSLFKAAMADIKRLEKLLGKEGDAVRRPFKVAAPPSQRGNWSRFWAPSWTERGKDKDTMFEMDAVLESLMKIQSEVQQMRSGISNVRSYARGIQDPNIQQVLNGLSDTDWESTLATVDRLSSIFDNDGQINSIRSSANQIQIEMQNVQTNMYNLRLRDPVKGKRNLPSAVNEYSDLSRSLQRLYMNPLSEKALYYTQKLHGRLEDALNARPSGEDAGYQDWSQSPEFELGKPAEPSSGGFTSPAAGQPMAPPTSPLGNAVEQITKDPDVLELLVQWLDTTSRKTNMSGETKQAINTLYDLLNEKRGQLPQETVQTNDQPMAPPDRSTFGDPDTDLDRFNDMSNLGANQNITNISINVQKLTKMADVLEDVDGGLAELLRDYIREQEEELPYFPETASLIKEELASGRKLTQKKGGAVALNT